VLYAYRARQLRPANENGLASRLKAIFARRDA
jgi:hypothetical protein